MPKDTSVLDDLKDHVYREMIDQGVEDSKAETVSARLRDHFRKHWGGQQIYFTIYGGERERNEEMFSRYDGKNRDELMREYGISQTYFYKIIKVVRASRKKNA